MKNLYELRRQHLIAQLTHGDSILDIGCAYMPNRFLRGGTVVGLDLNTMELSPPYTEHIIGDITHISEILDQRQFDTIILGEVIEHFEQPYDLLRKIRGHISIGGKLILSTPNPLGLPVVLVEYLRLRKFFYTPNHLYYFTPRWVWRLLEHSGYHVIRTIGCGVSLGKWPIPAPATLSYTVIYVATPA